MTWAEAVEAMKQGKKVCRHKWGIGIWIFIDEKGVNMSPELRSNTEYLSKELDYNNVYDALDAYNDAIASDWEIVE